MIDHHPAHAGALLTIDLNAICDNWRLLKARIRTADCAAVVKANAYGLGASRVAQALFDVGCLHFFVAHLDEAIELRSCLHPSTRVYVLHGPPSGTESEFVAHNLIPVLNSLEQLDDWHKLASHLGNRLRGLVQVDTGMSRLGLSFADLDVLATDSSRLRGIDVLYSMSHLASAEDQTNPFNNEQLNRFVAARKRLPDCPASFANSSGVFLGSPYHFDLVRPGAALYGIAPVAGAANPMRSVIRLQAKVMQVRFVEAGTPVGYGGTWRTKRRSRIATISVGYADGFLRSISNRGLAYVDGAAVPLIGNVSMDTITIDVSDVPESRVHADALVDLISPENGVDRMAVAAGTIGFEVLTSLGSRYSRRYVGGEQTSASTS